jgi:hypothetical protein
MERKQRTTDKGGFEDFVENMHEAAIATFEAAVQVLYEGCSDVASLQSEDGHSINTADWLLSNSSDAAGSLSLSDTACETASVASIPHCFLPTTTVRQFPSCLRLPSCDSSWYDRGSADELVDVIACCVGRLRNMANDVQPTA